LELRKRYKGEEVTVSQLLPGDVVALEKQAQSELVRIGAAKQPILGQVEGWNGPADGRGYFTVAWRQRKDTWTRESVVIHGADTFFRLTGSMKGVVKRSGLEWNRANLHNTLSKPGLLSGSDPELWVLDGKGKVMPAFGFLQSKKVTTHETAYWDGVQAEFRVTPGSCLDGFVTSVRNGFSNALYHARKIDPKARISLMSVVDISREDMDSWKDDQVAFGCSPSLNAYDDFAQMIAEDPRGILWRPAGGHMHFGMEQLKNKQVAPEIVKVLDKVAGTVAVSMFAKYDDPRRRMLYGKAGEYRLPKHGLEYRVLSPMWLCAPGVAQLQFEIARMAISLGLRGLGELWDATEEETRATINDTNPDAARVILKRNEGVLKAVLMACYGRYPAFDKPNLKVALHAIMNGVETVCDPMEIEQNWALGYMNEGMRYARWSGLAEAACRKLGL
jgi:hypothetical protein